MLVALDEDRFQRGEDVGAVADIDYAQRVERVDHCARPDRNAGGPQRTGKADDVVRHQAGRWIEVVDGHYGDPNTIVILRCSPFLRASLEGWPQAPAPAAILRDAAQARGSSV